MSEVSVIVPVYNAENYLEECIESVIRQTFSDWKLLLVDDGSTDRSGEISDRYAASDHRITVIHQANQGSNAAVRAGIMAADSEWIMFLDADDMYQPDMIKKMLLAADQYKADCVRCGYEKFTEDGKTERPLQMKDHVMNRNEINDLILYPFYEMDGNIYRNWSAPRWDKIFRRTILIQAYANVSPLTTVGEDLEMNLHFLEYAGTIVNIDAYLYRYRVLAASLAHGYSVRMEKQYRILWTAVNSAAEQYRHPFCAKDRFQDSGIISMMAELLHTDTDSEKKKSTFRHLYAMMANKSNILKLLAHMDFPFKTSIIKVLVSVRKHLGGL